MTELNSIRKELGLMTTAELGYWLFGLIFGLSLGFLLGMSFQ